MLVLPGADLELARTLAAPEAAGPGFSFLDAPPGSGPYLALTATHLELRLSGTAMQPVHVDWNDPALTRRVRAGRRGDLARALGLHRRAGLSILDATCGLGRDAAVLLALGCRVWGCERSPVMLALLRDGLRRAALAAPARDWLPRWGGLYPGSAVDWLGRCNDGIPDAVYVDPMFGQAGRRALPRREMQILHATVGADRDAGAVLEAARAAGVPRIVVKRHPRHPPLARPNDTLGGGRVCFDVYRNAPDRPPQAGGE